MIAAVRKAFATAGIDSGDVSRSGARSPAGQGSEAVLGCEILNRMIAFGRPVSYHTGS